jgi:hypothetical protein
MLDLCKVPQARRDRICRSPKRERVRLRPAKGDFIPSFYARAIVVHASSEMGAALDLACLPQSCLCAVGVRSIERLSNSGRLQWPLESINCLALIDLREVEVGDVRTFMVLPIQRSEHLRQVPQNMHCRERLTDAGCSHSFDAATIFSLLRKRGNLVLDKALHECRSRRVKHPDPAGVGKQEEPGGVRKSVHH